MTTPRRRLAAWAGMIGPALFVAVFTVEGWARPGYQTLGMYVSGLSLGSRGFVQIANFMVLGVLLLVLATGVAAELRPGVASRAGPILLAIIAVSLFASGPFVMDPMNTPREQWSTHGIIHQLFGAVVFSLMPVTCFVFWRRFRADPAWRPFSGWTLAAGLVIVAAVALLKVAQLGLPPNAPNALTAAIGLVQRAALIAFLLWLFAFARRIAQRLPLAR